MRTSDVLSVLIIVAIWPASSVAQPVAQPTDSSPWDVTAVAGFLGSRPDLPTGDRYQDQWDQTGQGGLIVGRHLSPHFKAELELTAGAESRLYVQRFARVPNIPQLVPYASERLSTVREISALASWQFFDNEWVHPFVQAGVGAVFERVRWRTWGQSIYVGDPRFPGSQVTVAQDRVEGPETTTIAHALVGAGAKFYVADNAFVRTDGRGGISGKRHHVSLRVGFGLDF
jgi:opacity protein-like surface antigen